MYVCLLAILWIILGIHASINRLERKLKRIDISLKVLLNRMEIEVPSHLSDRVQQMALDPYRKLALVS